MISDENSRPRGEARVGQEVEANRHLATTNRMTQGLNVVGQQIAQSAIRAAYIAVSLCAGRRPDEIAAEIAGRAVAALRGKPEGRPAGATE